MGGDYQEVGIEPVTAKWGILIALFSSPLFLGFVLRHDAARGRAAWVIAMVLLCIVRAFWRRRGFLWFWVTISLLALLHVPLILFVNWMPQSIAPPVLLVAALPDLALDYGAVRMVEKLVRKNLAA